MKKIYAVAHTHWDFEWYFTRQHSQVQFAFHMDEVFEALSKNILDYYVLDGQMSIVDDYLQAFPEKTTLIKKFVRAGRLFIGPWYTQVDEMVTSGESIIRNLNLGLDAADDLGGAMMIGYLPDSFGQSQDMPKIYKGLGIDRAIFWRGIPNHVDARYFYWQGDDGSKVLTANIKDGYVAGLDLVEKDHFETMIARTKKDNNIEQALLPVGGDQRPVDFNLKAKIKAFNQAHQDQGLEMIESNYPHFFDTLEAEDLPTYEGEFIEPSVSKIHRGIYASRADLKQLYDQLERRMVYQVEPLMALAARQGIEPKEGIIKNIWKTIALGQAHDSSGACNGDETNADIKQRGLNALRQAESLRDYLLRKMSTANASEQDQLLVWNPLPFEIQEVREFEVSTINPTFKLTWNDEEVAYDVIDQHKENAAVLRRDPSAMTDEHYYVTKIAVAIEMPALDWIQFDIVETNHSQKVATCAAKTIENDLYKIEADAEGLHLTDKITCQTYSNFLTVEDGSDEGDNYDYSPAFHDWILNLDFNGQDVQAKCGEFLSELVIKGSWQLPKDLNARQAQKCDGQVAYQLKLKLKKDNPAIDIHLSLDNQVYDHRLRLVVHTDVKAQYSYADTPFGIIKRPVVEEHLKDWKTIGYKEEPTSLRPMLHLANIHNDEKSYTFLGLGAKEFQVIGDKFDKLAVTILRGVGYLGRPDMKRRPGDASGLQTKYVATPDSQLQGSYEFKGQLVIADTFDPQALQNEYARLGQDGLYYQTQTINEFTTPIEYFKINRHPQTIHHQQDFYLDQLQVVFSSLKLTESRSGYELRVYNASDQTVTAPGTLHFNRPVSLTRLNLRGKRLEDIPVDGSTYAMTTMRPGEIRTYGIFPH